MGAKFTDWDEVLETTAALTVQPEQEQAEAAAAARTVARNARDKDELADLLGYLGLPRGEDDLTELLPLLNPPTDQPDAGAPMTTSAPTNNAYLAVAVSMLKDGTDTATVQTTLELSGEELAEAIEHAGLPEPDAAHDVPGTGTADCADSGDDRSEPADDAAPTDVGDPAAEAPCEPEPSDGTGTAGQVPAASRIEELLAWAEQYDDRSRQLAAQARAALDGLTELRDNAAAIEEAKAKVAALERELARAREELRMAMAGDDSAAPAGPALTVASAPKQQPQGEPAARPVADRETIRRWAKAKGLRVADRGALSKDVITAYNAVHNGAVFEEVAS
ncbi:hypothetical protein [Streptomyces sp. NPDC057413]|uniref:Lsr2 family DNA-binding protein n=1 Tax=Streptomyces sp. NPDC057413 TaxID=3346124 RepID=UPI003675C458